MKIVMTKIPKPPNRQPPWLTKKHYILLLKAGCIRKTYCNDHIFENKISSAPVLPDQEPAPQKAIFYIMTGLVQQTVQIVVRLRSHNLTLFVRRSFPEQFHWILYADHFRQQGHIFLAWL